MPSKKDIFEGEQARIKVNPSGDYFHLHNEGDISEINITDIATALSRQCRFTGHLLPGVEIYSVAEHCVLVSYIVEKMGGDAEEVFHALMHDSAEAYLSDIAAPFKGAIGNYHDVEKSIMDRIEFRYGLCDQGFEKTKLADWYALFIEARQIVCPDEEDLKTWRGYEEFGEASKDFHTEVQCWLPSRAKMEFLARFAQCQDMIMGGM